MADGESKFVTFFLVLILIAVIAGLVYYIVVATPALNPNAPAAPTVTSSTSDILTITSSPMTTGNTSVSIDSNGDLSVTYSGDVVWTSSSGKGATGAKFDKASGILTLGNSNNASLWSTSAPSGGTGPYKLQLVDAAILKVVDASGNTVVNVSEGFKSVQIPNNTFALDSPGTNKNLQVSETLFAMQGNGQFGIYVKDPAGNDFTTSYKNIYISGATQGATKLKYAGGILYLANDAETVKTVLKDVSASVTTGDLYFDHPGRVVLNVGGVKNILLDASASYYAYSKTL